MKFFHVNNDDHRPISGHRIHPRNSIQAVEKSPINAFQPNYSKENDSGKKLDKIKKCMLKWCEYCTWGGINNMVRTERTSVFTIWLVLYLSSITYCIYNCTNLTISFFNYDVLINMEFKTEMPTDFPAVTICNLNPIDRKKASTYINQVLNASDLNYVRNTFLIDIDPSTVINLIKSSIISDPNLNYSNRINFGFSLDYMMLTCQFNGYECNKSDFITTYNYDYGNCFTFNSGYDSNGNQIPIKQISEAGSDKSLKIDLFLGDEFIQSEFLLNSGARVIVHNQSVTPIFKSEGRDVASGYLSNIGLTRSFFNKLNQPYSDCISNTSDPNSFNSIFYKSIFNILNIKTYRQKNCLQLCLQEYINNQCQCLDGSLPNIYNQSKICNNLTTLHCIQDIKSKYFSNNTLVSQCYKYCPLECSSSSFLYSGSISRYPSMYYVNYLQNRLNAFSKILAPNQTSRYLNSNNITKNIVYINVFYDDLLTTFIQEIPAIDGNFLIGNLGGYIGLFAGLTLLSFVEILELFIEVLMILFDFHIENIVSLFIILF
jgi:hypothetical protein